MRYGRKHIKLQDCRKHGPGSGAELFLVEGDSAADSVTALRNSANQAVLPMQGKPMNALKASESRVRANTLFKAIEAAVGTGMGENFRAAELRFEKIVLLFDPDADGIHAGALMLMFLHRKMPALVQGGQVLTVRAPLFRITVPGVDQVFYAGSEGHLDHIRKQLADQGHADCQTHRYRGLGSLEPTLLESRCINPKTRQADLMSPKDAEMAIEVFGG